MAASIRDIKARVVATKKTAQITKAMNMVSASKLKGAQKSTESFRPYMKRVEEIISSVSKATSSHCPAYIIALAFNAFAV